MGENLSGRGMLEGNVCIGDVYALGMCRIQVSQPRTPCWKINHRFDCESLSLFVHNNRITGWYYRVLAGGRVEPETTMALLERDINPVSIDVFWRILNRHRPATEDLQKILAASALSPDWKKRVGERMAWSKRAGARTNAG